MKRRTDATVLLYDCGEIRSTLVENRNGVLDLPNEIMGWKYVWNYQFVLLFDLVHCAYHLL